MIPTYINTPSLPTPKSPVVVYQMLCYEIEPKPVWCELPDDFGKKNRPPEFISMNSVTASGTASGATTSTIPLGMRYVVDGEK